MDTTPTMLCRTIDPDLDGEFDMQRIAIDGTDYSYHDTPYVLLWKAVILQALHDAAHGRSSCGKSQGQLKKYEAINWLKGNSKRFYLACDFSGWPPTYVRRAISRVEGRG